MWAGGSAAAAGKPLAEEPWVSDSGAGPTWEITAIEAEATVTSGPSGPYDSSTPLTHNSSYLLLWAGQFVSQMGDRLAMVAFPWLVYHRTGSTLGTGVILAMYTLPYVLFGPFAGVLIDRVNKRTVMVLTDVARAALVLLVPLVAQWSLPAVFALSFVMGSAAVLFDPCKIAILPDIVHRARLMRANSLLATGENLTEVLGYAAAGVALATLATSTAFRIDAGTFAVSAAALALMRYAPPARAAAERAGSTVRRELREGVSFLRRHRGVRANTVMVVAAAAGSGATYPLTFFLAVQVLHGGTKAFGLFEAAIGAGFLGGSLALAALAARVRQGVAMTAGFASAGAALAAVAVAPGVWVAVVPFAAAGVANAAALIAVDTYLQQAVPERLRGRVLGTRFALTQGTYAASVMVAGALAGVFDVRALFVVAGALVALPAIAGVFVREIREA